METVKLRPAAFGDLARIGHVAGQAFFDDNVLGHVIHPNRKQYPMDFDLFWARGARTSFWDYRCKQVVAVDQDAGGNDVVVGYAQWDRHGKGGKNPGLWWFDPRNLAKPVASFIIGVSSLIWPNRAVQPGKEDIVQRAYPFLADCWSGERSESWYLNILAVHPDFQGKGIGRLLVFDGLGRADREGVCTSVISAKGKEPFYQKCGFDIEDGHIGMGEGNPLAGVDGGRMFWRMPQK